MSARVLPLLALAAIGCNSVKVDLTIKPDGSLSATDRAAIATLRFDVSGAETATATRHLTTPFKNSSETIVYASSATHGTLGFMVTGYTSDGTVVASGSGSARLSPPFTHATITLSAASSPLGPDLGVASASDMNPSPDMPGVAMLSIDATSHDFGNAVVNSPSIAKVFTLTNGGTASSTPVVTSLSGPNSSMFALVNDGCNGQPLAVGASCVVSVTFTPSATGTATATFQAAIDDGMVSSTLTGTGLAPGALMFAPGSWDFMTVDAGSSSPSQTFVLTNTGGSATTAITTTPSGDTSQFAIISDGCNGMTLAAQATCSVVVKFAPQTYGTKGLMILANAATGGAAQVAASGTGRGSYTLTVTIAGNGAGSVSASGLSCTGNSCSGTYTRTNVATMVAITATPAASSSLSWSGDCNGTTSPCTITMDANHAATATFTLLSFTLDVSTRNVATAFGTVSSSSGGINCGSACSATFNYGTSVTLTSHPTGTALLQSWNGDCAGAGATCTVTMTQNRSTQATFRPPINYAFVSSTSYPAVLGSVTAADQHCNDLAAAAGLSGSYVALLSTSTVDAKSRVGTAHGWMRTDGKPIMDALSLTASGSPATIPYWYPLELDENGNIVNQAVMTGSLADGTKNVGYTCSDYTSTTGYASIGCPSCGETGWLALGDTDCASTYRLYCFEKDYSNTLTLPQQSNPIAFVTKSFWDTNSGLAAADALCQSEASAAGLDSSPSYKALLGTSTMAPSSRFNATYQWMRADGVSLNVGNASLFDSTQRWLAVLDAAADGSYQGTYYVSIGSDNVNAPSSNDCNDWRSDVTDMGVPMQYATQVGQRNFISIGSVACSKFMRLYCLF